MLFFEKGRLLYSEIVGRAPNSAAATPARPAPRTRAQDRQGPIRVVAAIWPIWYKSSCLTAFEETEFRIGPVRTGAGAAAPMGWASKRNFCAKLGEENHCQMKFLEV